MPRFRVTGLLVSDGSPGAEPRSREETLEAASAAEAMTKAERVDFLPVRAERDGYSLPFARRARQLDTTLFTQELLSLLRAGLTLNEAIDTLHAKETQPGPRAILERLRAQLQEGRTFSHALAEQGEMFGDIYVATVKASERTGDLVPALTRYLAYRRQLDTLRTRVVSAAIYPLMLVAAGAAVVLFMLLYLVPRFSQIYGDLGRLDLPLASRLLLEWGQLLHAHTAAVLTALGALFLLAVWSILQPEWRAALSRLTWRLRGIGHWLRLMHLSRFYRAISMLLQSGVSLPAAMRMTEPLLHPVLRPGLAPALSAIEEGRPLSTALGEHGLLTEVAQRLVGAGERSGNLAEMLEKTADFHDEETSLWVERFTRVFEPVLMLVIGLFIGLIVVFMYLPIFEMAGSWQ